MELKTTIKATVRRTGFDDPGPGDYIVFGVRGMGQSDLMLCDCDGIDDAERRATFAIEGFARHNFAHLDHWARTFELRKTGTSAACSYLQGVLDVQPIASEVDAYASARVREIADRYRAFVHEAKQSPVTTEIVSQKAWGPQGHYTVGSTGRRAKTVGVAENTSYVEALWFARRQAERDVLLYHLDSPGCHYYRLLGPDGHECAVIKVEVHDVRW